MVWGESLISTYNYERSGNYYDIPADNDSLHYKGSLGTKVKIGHINEMRKSICNLLRTEIDDGGTMRPIYDILSEGAWTSIAQFHSARRAASKVLFNSNSTEYNYNYERLGGYSELEETLNDEIGSTIYSKFSGSNWRDGSVDGDGDNLLTASDMVRNIHLYELRKAVELIEIKCLALNYNIPTGIENLADTVPKAVDGEYSGQMYKNWKDIILYPKFASQGYTNPGALLSYPDDWNSTNSTRTPTEVRIRHIDQLRNEIDALWLVEFTPRTEVWRGAETKVFVPTFYAKGVESTSNILSVTKQTNGAETTVSVSNIFRPTDLVKTN